MDALDEQLAKLKLLNSKPLPSKIPSTGCGNVGISANNNNSNVIGSIGTIMPSMNGSPNKRTGPAVPPKPNKYIFNLPKVPQSTEVRQQFEPLYSKRLQSDKNETINQYSITPLSSSQVTSQTGLKMPILHRKQPAYIQQNVYSNMKMTLDNPAILDQQLEALEHHKKQLERKGLLPGSNSSSSLTGVPKLSSSSFINGELQAVARTSPSVQMMAKLLEAQQSTNNEHAYSNIPQNLSHKKQLSGSSAGSNCSSSSAGSGGAKHQQQLGIVYSNIMHQNPSNDYNGRMSRTPVRMPGQDLVYSNIDYKAEDLPPPPPPIEMPPPPLHMGHMGNIAYINKKRSPTDMEDDLPPPPSPVSSSYSELRRAADVYPQLPPYPVDTKTIYQANGNIPSNVQVGNQVPLNNTGGSNGQQTYVNTSFNDYGYGRSASQTFSQSSSASDYYGYGSISQGSSTYESIYEPINPRPPSQLSSRSNYSLYTSYVNGPQTLSSGSRTPTLSTSGAGGNNNHKEAEVEALTDLLVHSMGPENDVESFEDIILGNCVKCAERVIGENSGCTAMGQIYHISCFTCSQCQINLQGKPFYELEKKPYCKDDYLNTLEKCSVCMRPILERILRATGKPYHPQCFTCIVCKKSLDGVPFTVDTNNQNYCIEDFHKKFAPRCSVCHEPIMPEPGQEETIRVVALDRSFHFHCYKCEDCGLILSSEAEGAGCYPLDNHVLCKSCNAERVQALTNKITTEL